MAFVRLNEAYPHMVKKEIASSSTPSPPSQIDPMPIEPQKHDREMNRIEKDMEYIKDTLNNMARGGVPLASYPPRINMNAGQCGMGCESFWYNSTNVFLIRMLIIVGIIVLIVIAFSIVIGLAIVVSRRQK